MIMDFNSTSSILGSLPNDFYNMTANPVLFLIPFKLQFNLCMDTILLFCGAFTLLLIRKRFASFHSGLPFMAAIWVLIIALFLNLDIYSSVYLLSKDTGLKTFSLFWDSFILNKTNLRMKSWFYGGNIFVLAFIFRSFRQGSINADLYYSIPLLTLLLACIGSLVLQASNLLTLLLCIETFSFLSLYIIRLTSNKMSAEASLLYFFMSMLSTGFLSLGFLLIYIGTGSISLMDISDHLFSYYNSAEQLKINSNIAFGFGFVFGTFLFKLAAFPCFFWLPLTFKAMSFAGVCLTSFTVKFINVCLFINLCVIVLPNYLALTSNALWILICSLGSITVGTFLALQEFNFRKFLAFTSINQMGYILLGLLPLANNIFTGFDSLSYFVFIYFLSSLLFLSSLSGLRINNLQLQTLSDLRVVFLTNPWGAWLCLLSIFAMAGLPPTAGFWAKYYIIRNCWDATFMVTWSESFIHLFRFSLWLIVFLNFFSAIYYVRLVMMLIFNTIGISWQNFVQNAARAASEWTRFWREASAFRFPDFKKGLKHALEFGYSSIDFLLEEGEHSSLDLTFFTTVGQVLCAVYLIIDFVVRLF